MKRLLPLLPLVLAVGCAFTTGEKDPVGNAGAGIDTTRLIRGDSASLQERVDSIGFRMAQLRGLSFTQRIKASWVSRTALPGLLDSIDKAGSDAGTASPALTFDELSYGLGYTASPRAYDSSQSRFYSSAIAGFYIPGSNRLWIVTDASIADMESTIAHELVHALQDQAFDLNQPRTSTLDGDYAQTMLIEGDAEYAQMLYDRDDPSLAQIDARNDFLGMNALASVLAAYYPDLPLVTTLPGFAPYYCGPRFVHELRRSGGWPLVNSVQGNPPKGTHHVLVPSDGIARSPFRSFQAARSWDAIGHLESWKAMGSEQLGQLMLGTLLMSWRIDGKLGAGSAPEAWNGDRIWIWRKDSLHYATAGVFAWSSESAAKDFLTAWQAASTHAPGNLLSRSARSGSTTLMAWGPMDSSSLDSLWKDLQDTAQSATIAGRTTTRPLPHIPVRPWGARPPRL